METIFNIVFGKQDTFKRVKLSDMKAKTTKQEQDIIPHLNIGTKNEVIKNPFSGEEVELSPEAVAVYDLVIGSQLSANEKFDKKVDNGREIELFSAGKDIFIRNWPKEYSLLLD